MSGLTVIKDDGTVVEVPITIESAGGAALCAWVDDRAVALRKEAAGDRAPSAVTVAPAAVDEGEG